MLKDMKILYVEDEELIREGMVETLSFFSNNVISAADGNIAYELYVKEKPDIIIVDIELPGMNGLKLSELIRKNDKTVQIIVTTAYTNTEYLLKAVELNFVKYLVKPVRLIELEKALNTCMENLQTLDNPIKYLNDKDYYNIKSQKLIIDEEEVYLDFNEQKFFDLLIKTPGRVISYDELENTIWYDEGMTESAVRSLVFNIRKKLPQGLIVNVPKRGYKINISK